MAQAGQGHIKMRKKYAVYARVSTRDQEDNFSLANQIQSCKSFVDFKKGFTSEKLIYKDVESGANLDRSSFDRLMRDAVGRKFDAVIVYKIDRFSRNLRDLLNSVEKLKELGVEFQSVSENIDTDSLIGELILHILGSFSNFERKVILQRMREGRVKRLEARKFPGGLTPYGYDYDEEKEQLVVNQDEAKVIKQIFALVIDQDMSMQQICEYLNAFSVPTKLMNLGKKKQPAWRSGTLKRILHNPVYYGDFSYNKTKEILKRIKVRQFDKDKGDFIWNEKKSRFKLARPRNEWIVIAVSPIITRFEFDRAQEIIESHRIKRKRQAKNNYLVSNMLYCAQCSKGFTGQTLDKEYSYYRCNGRVLKKLGIKCDMPYWRVRDVDGAIWRVIAELINQPLMISRLVSEREKLASKKAIGPEDEVTQIDKLIHELESERFRLVSAYAKGIITEEDLQKQLDSIDKEVETLERRRVVRVEESKLNAVQESQLKSVESWCRGVGSILDSLGFDERKRLTEALIRDITLGREGNLDLNFSIPVEALEPGNSADSYKHYSGRSSARSVQGGNRSSCGIYHRCSQPPERHS
jgi:site-specific DNA recombinase